MSLLSTNSQYKTSPFAHGIMFHHFHNETHPKEQGSISQNDLSKLIEFIHPKRILTPEKWLKKVEKKCLEPRDLCLTFDDALLCQFEIAKPVLDAYKLKAFWFVYTGIFDEKKPPLEVYRRFRHEKFSSIEEFYKAFDAHIFQTPYAEKINKDLCHFCPKTFLQEHAFYTPEDRRFRYIRDEILGPQAYYSIMNSMIESYGVHHQEDYAKGLWMLPKHLKTLKKEGHIIGLHSHSHPTRMEKLSYQEQYQEYCSNHKALKKLLNKPCTVMSHPSNSYAASTLEVLKKLKIPFGFRADMEKGWNRSWLEMPREDHMILMRKIP